MKFHLLGLILSIFLFSSCESRYIPDSELEYLLEEMNEENYNQAIQRANELIKDYPNDNSLYFILGKSYFNIGKTKQALVSLNKSIELEPNQGLAYGYRATLISLEELPFSEAVIADYDAAIKFKPDDIRIIRSKGNYLNKQGFYQEAIEEYNRVLELDSTNYNVMISKCYAMSKLNDNDNALRILNEIIAVDPNNSFAYEARAQINQTIENYTESLADYEKIISLDKLNNSPIVYQAYGYNNKGFVLYKLEMYDSALLAINHSLKLYPENSFAYKNRALVNLALNNQENSCLDLQKAIELGFTEQYGEEVNELIKTNCN